MSNFLFLSTRLKNGNWTILWNRLTQFQTGKQHNKQQTTYWASQTSGVNRVGSRQLFRCSRCRFQVQVFQSRCRCSSPDSVRPSAFWSSTLRRRYIGLRSQFEMFELQHNGIWTTSQKCKSLNWKVNCKTCIPKSHHFDMYKCDVMYKCEYDVSVNRGIFWRLYRPRTHWI